MSVKTSVARTRSPWAGSSHSRTPVHSIATAGSSPIVPAIVTRRDVVDGSGATLQPSGSPTPMRPDRTTPTWRTWHRSVPTTGLMCVDHRQPGACVARATISVPNWTTSSMTPGASTTRSGRSNDFVGEPPSPSPAAGEVRRSGPSCRLRRAEVSHQLAHPPPAERRYRTTRHSRGPPSWTIS
jgi:hypothetical protein